MKRALLFVVSVVSACNDGEPFDACTVVAQRRYLSEEEYGCWGGGFGCRTSLHFESRGFHYTVGDVGWTIDEYECEGDRIRADKTYEIEAIGTTETIEFDGRVLDDALLRWTASVTSTDTDGVVESRYIDANSLYLPADLLAD